MLLFFCCFAASGWQAAAQPWRPLTGWRLPSWFRPTRGACLMHWRPAAMPSLPSWFHASFHVTFANALPSQQLAISVGWRQVVSLVSRMWTQNKTLCAESVSQPKSLLDYASILKTVQRCLEAFLTLIFVFFVIFLYLSPFQTLLPARNPCSDWLELLQGRSGHLWHGWWLWEEGKVVHTKGFHLDE